MTKKQEGYEVENGRGLKLGDVRVVAGRIY